MKAGTRARTAALALGLHVLGLLVLGVGAGHARADSTERGPIRAAPEPAAEPGRSLFRREPAWRGPRVKLSYRLMSLRDDLGGGAVQTAGFSGFLPTRSVRAGGGVDIGGRSYDGPGTDGFLSGNLFVGYQLLRHAEPAVPYVVAVGELGLVFGKRFHTPVSRSIRGAGVELGCDLRIVRGLSTAVGALFMMYTMDGLAYQSWGLRVSVGL